MAEIRMRLSEKDYQVLKKKAEERKLRPTTYARSLMLRLLRYEQAPQDLPLSHQGGQ